MEITLEQAIELHYWRVDCFEHETHVYPLNDFQGHILSFDRCRCHPAVKQIGMSTMYVHNSYDGREEYE